MQHVVTYANPLMLMLDISFIAEVIICCLNLCQPRVPYWHEIILHIYIISAPAGCRLIHWGRYLGCGMNSCQYGSVKHRNLQLHVTNV